MPRYVDTEDFKHLINASSLYGTKEWVKVMNLLADTPTADVVEVKHGKWELYDAYKQTIDGRTFDGWCECSECKMMFKYEIQDANFCPHCGARMEVE